MSNTRYTSGLVDRVVRNRIIGGDFAPGTRLPHRLELVKSLGTSVQTLQRAMDRLIADGFVYTRKGTGTFVCDHLPHLHRVALAFHQTDENRSLFELALAKAAAGISATGPTTLVKHFQFDRRAHEKLITQIAAHTLAGLILVHMHPASSDTPVTNEPNLPRVLINASDAVLPTVDVDYHSFAPRAVERLFQRGRRKIAVLYHDGLNACPELYARAIAAAGLESRSYWAVPGTHRSPSVFLHLLKELPDEKRPDALIIADDNLVAPTVAGLLESGWRVPDELAIVAHTNFPLVVPSLLPMERLGYDCTELLRACLNSLDLQRAGQSPPKHVAIPAYFEDEINFRNGLVTRPLPSMSVTSSLLEENHA